MPQIINTNIASLNAQRNLNASQTSLATSLQRLSSGLRINSAKDDAAGLAISDRMTSQINGLNQALRNSNDGISMAQTAEGGLSTASDLLQRIRQLAVQSANATNSPTDRQSLQQEVSQLQQELNRVATTTQFNGMNLLDGTLAAAQFQVGANANQTITMSIGSAKAADIGNYGLNSGSGAGYTSAATTAATSAANSNLAAQTLTIAGNGTSKTVTAAAGQSMKTVADNINAQTSYTGVTATAMTQATLGNLQTAGTLTFNLYGSNSTAVAIGATVSSTGDLSGLASAINAQTASTGITATVNQGTVTLQSKDGYDIKIENFLNSAGTGGTIDFTGQDPFANTASGAAVTLGGATTTDSSTVGGQLKFSSANGYTVSSGASGTLFSATTPQASTLSAVSSIDVGTVNGANNALATVDAALASINSQRGALGAMQNRFQSTINNLQATSENLSAAKSRIMDTDFASETAIMTRGQILQQAGMAMLAQANALPNNVLTLLK